MNGLRSDIAAAVSRMHLTFGTRTAIKNLPESCEPGELVQALVACTYDHSEGLLVLTDRRVMAIRDDFSRFRLQHLALSDVRALDYDPTVHDGLAVLTDQARIAVRRMVRADSEAFVQALTQQVPDIVRGASRPGRRVEVPVAAATAAPTAAPTTAASGPTEQAVTTPESSVPDIAISPAAFVPAVADDEPTAAVTRQGEDTEVLLGVLADLHAKGLLSTEELAAKIAQVTTRA